MSKADEIENKEIIKVIFNDFINQDEKAKTICVGILQNGENCNNTKIKMRGKQKEFMKDYLKKIGG